MKSIFNFTVLFLTVLGLTACVTVGFDKLSDEQIKAISYSDLCTSTDSTHIKAKLERERRGVTCIYELDHCKFDRKLKVGTEQFENCVIEEKRISQQKMQQSLHLMNSGIAGLEDNYYRSNLPANQYYKMRAGSYGGIVNTDCKKDLLGNYSCQSY